MLGWRSTLLLIGLLGVPLVLVILWQSGILREQVRRRGPAACRRSPAAALLMTQTHAAFLRVFPVDGELQPVGIQSWLIPVLHDVHGLASTRPRLRSRVSWRARPAACCSAGGLPIAATGTWPSPSLLTVAAAALLLLVSSKTMSEAMTLMVLLAAGLLVGASRTPRDVMLKDASPPGRDREGVRICQRRAAAGRRAGACTVRLPVRPRSARSGPGAGRLRPADQPVVRRDGARQLRAQRACSPG